MPIEVKAEFNLDAEVDASCSKRFCEMHLKPPRFLLMLKRLVVNGLISSYITS
jgi:hypothetical protein